MKCIFWKFRFVHGIVFLSAFAKLRKSTASIIMSVASSCLSVRMEKLVSHKMDFYTIEYLGFFETVSRNLEFH